MSSAISPSILCWLGAPQTPTNDSPRLAGACNTGRSRGPPHLQQLPDTRNTHTDRPLLSAPPHSHAPHPRLQIDVADRDRSFAATSSPVAARFFCVRFKFVSSLPSNLLLPLLHSSAPSAPRRLDARPAVSAQNLYPATKSRLPVSPFCGLIVSS